MSDVLEGGANPGKKKNNLLTYGAIAAGGVVILLVMLNKGGGSGDTGTGGGVNTQQPVIIPAGGGDSGPDATTTAALAQLANNQQTLADGLAAGFASIGQLMTSQNTAAESIPAGATSIVPDAPEAAVRTIFGATVDIQSAQSVFGSGSDYKYVDTSNMTDAQTRTALQAAGSQGLIVGGYAAGGGVDQNEAAGLGITRVAGNDRYETLAAIRGVNF